VGKVFTGKIHSFVRLHREVLDCASPLALFSRQTESGRGLPHSRTLARRPCRHSPTRSILSAPISFGFVRINSHPHSRRENCFSLMIRGAYRV
jgi:hypothetical protein